MAKYEVLEDSVIGSGLVKKGEIIEYDGKSEGKPGSNLRLIKPVQAAAAASAAEPAATVVIGSESHPEG